MSPSEVERVNLPVLFGGDFDFSINQADFYICNARLASEVLFHPVCSKVSGHALDAHFDVLDLCLNCWHNTCNQQ